MKFCLMSVIALTVLTTFVACKKDSDPTTDPDTEMTIHSDDQVRVSNEMDAVANDANIAVESNSTFSGRLQNPNSLICDATLAVDISANLKKITITYDGTNCSGTRTRTGAVVLSMATGVLWKDAGAVLTVSYENLKITRVSDNKSITINGTHAITNVSGGRLSDLATQISITHTINSSNMAITFDDNSQRTWQVARQRMFTYNNGLVITITGMHTDGNNTHISEWGTTRLGNAFTTSIAQSLVIRQDCNFQLTNGEIRHDRLLTSSTVTFGLDATGNPTSCPGAGTYYFKLHWTGAGGNAHNIIRPY